MIKYGDENVGQTAEKKIKNFFFVVIQRQMFYLAILLQIVIACNLKRL